MSSDLAPLVSGLASCLTCTHWRNTVDGYQFCTAFPTGIPDEIALGNDPHREHYAGDGGVVYRPNSDVERLERRRAQKAAQPTEDSTRTPRRATRHNQPGDHPQGGEFASVDAGEAWAARSFDASTKKLTTEQRSAIAAYAGYGAHERINTAMRTLQYHKMSREDRTTMDRLNSACKAGATDADVVLYRGIINRSLAAKFDRLKRGDVIADEGFMSTTYDKSSVIDFLGVAADQGEVPIMLHIYTPQGTPSLYVDPVIEDLPGAYRQKEILLQSGRSMKVLRSERVYNDELGIDVATIYVELQEGSTR